MDFWPWDSDFYPTTAPATTAVKLDETSSSLVLSHQKTNSTGVSTQGDIQDLSSSITFLGKNVFTLTKVDAAMVAHFEIKGCPFEIKKKK